MSSCTPAIRCSKSGSVHLVCCVIVHAILIHTNGEIGSVDVLNCVNCNLSMHASEKEGTHASWCNACMHKPSRQCELGSMSGRLMLYICRLIRMLCASNTTHAMQTCIP
jgi:hypothetical protein